MTRRSGKFAAVYAYDGDATIALDPSRLTVLEGAEVFSQNSRAFEAATILILDGRIERVVPHDAPDVPTEPTPVRLDAHGKFVLPGLIDCAVHYSQPEPSEGGLRRTQVETGLFEAIAGTHAALRAGYTTLRCTSYGTSDVPRAIENARQLGLLAVPRLAASAAPVTSSCGSPDSLLPAPSGFVRCDGRDECRKVVRHLLDDDLHWLAVQASTKTTVKGGVHSSPAFGLAELEAIIEEAHSRGARVVTLATDSRSALEAVMAGADILERGPDEPNEQLARAMKASGTVFVPAITSSPWDSEGQASELSNSEHGPVGRQAMVWSAAGAGASVAAGSGASLANAGGRLDEAVALAAAGLEASGAILAATSVAAQGLGIANDVGSISAGQRAELLVLSANPVSDIGALLDSRRRTFVLRA